MTPGIHCCREDDDLAKAVRHMEALKIRRLPVINKSKRMIGILSLGDVSHSASGDLLSDALERGVIEAVITGRSPSDAGARAPCPSR